MSRGITSTRCGKSKEYKYVSYVKYLINGKPKYGWRAYIPMYRDGKGWWKVCDKERQAAIEVDKALLKIGKDPVNILCPRYLNECL